MEREQKEKRVFLPKCGNGRYLGEGQLMDGGRKRAH